MMSVTMFSCRSPMGLTEMLERVRILLVSSSLLAGASVFASPACPVLKAEKRSTLVDYVRKEYRIPDSVQLTLTKDAPRDDCYRELTFSGKGAVKTWELTMYLSPDQRFLSGELLDTTLDPEVERRRRQAEVMAGLIPNRGASEGSENAAVTIVEFSDFECPFCRRFAETLGQLSPGEKKDLRVVFHHMPLSGHPWARAAAEGAACAQLQGADAFWSLHDQLFGHQTELNQATYARR